MVHQLDTVEICEKARKKKERATMWSTFPKVLNRIAGRIGLLPTSDPGQIARIIEKSIAFNTLNGLISLERQGCTIEYKDLASRTQSIVLETLRDPKNNMERILRAVVKNTPK